MPKILMLIVTNGPVTIAGSESKNLKFAKNPSIKP